MRGLHVRSASLLRVANRRFALLCVADAEVRLPVLRPARFFCHDSPVTPTVLIVDDHPSFRASARAILEADGFTVVGEAEDGTTALAELRRLRPDVVLLDVQLPDMTGFDVFTFAVIVIVSSVRPWKALSKTTTAGRPVAHRAILTAFSTASAPELTRIDFCSSPAHGESSARRRHTSMQGVPQTRP